MDQIRDMLERIGRNPSLLYDSIVGSTDDYIYIVDMREDLALVSENMAGDFALPGRMVPGLIPLWQTLIHPRDQSRFQADIERMLRGESDVHDMEYQAQNRRGEYIWVHCRGLLRRNEEGEPTFFAGAERFFLWAVTLKIQRPCTFFVLWHDS